MNATETKRETILLYERTLANKHASVVEEFGEDLHNLVQRLWNTFLDYSGVGLSAPQIGVFQRVAVVNRPNCQFAMINPVIIKSEGEVTDWEACLSIPGASARGRIANNRAKVTRPEKVTLKAQDPDGDVHIQDFEGYLARIVSHECDHLDGIFFIHHLKPLERSLILSKMGNFEKHCMPEEAEETHGRQLLH